MNQLAIPFKTISIKMERVTTVNVSLPLNLYSLFMNYIKIILQTDTSLEDVARHPPPLHFTFTLISRHSMSMYYRGC